MICPPSFPAGQGTINAQFVIILTTSWGFYCNDCPCENCRVCARVFPVPSCIAHHTASETDVPCSVIASVLLSDSYNAKCHSPLWTFASLTSQAVMTRAIPQLRRRDATPRASRAPPTPPVSLPDSDWFSGPSFGRLSSNSQQEPRISQSLITDFVLQ
jgi:hypothetical protein